MHYNKIVEVLLSEYQGESFSRSLGKEDGSIWENEEDGTYSLIDSNGTTIKTGTLIKSENSFTLTVFLSNTDTENLLGNYKLFCFSIRDDDSSFNDVIGEYEIEYKEKKANS